jgi:negative regulator of sigma E activity
MKMDCNWTEKISLLIDGELSTQEAGAVERHIADCKACQHAREDFLLMRHQINSFRAEPNLIAQRQALKNILGDPRAASKSVGGWRERVSGVFALSRLSPALSAAAALVIVAVIVGVLMLRKPERVEVARDAKNETTVNANVPVAHAPDASTNGSNSDVMPVVVPNKDETASNVDVNQRKRRGENSRGVSIETASAEKSRRTSILNASKLREEASARRPKIVERLRLPLTPKVAVDNAEFVETELASLSSKLAPTDSGTSRHVEQAQVLLRSFRTARTGGDPSASDIAYEKRRSRELLYHNIVLRREAANKGDVAVASLLDNLEPILIDIANLPDRPAQEDVRSITDRMKKKNIVAMLQVANASRMY